MLVQWEEVGGEERFGEVNLPTLPIEGQFFNVLGIDFRIVSATWVIEGDVVEGHISVSA